jgi:hypothetical protein
MGQRKAELIEYCQIVNQPIRRAAGKPGAPAIRVWPDSVRTTLTTAAWRKSPESHGFPFTKEPQPKACETGLPSGEAAFRAMKPTRVINGVQGEANAVK